MSARFHFATRPPAKLLNLAACVASMLMLLAFPTQRVHQYSIHLRAPEIRRTIERHTFVVHPEAGTAERIAYQAVMPGVLEPVATGDALKPVVHSDIFRQVPISHLLARLKLGSSRSGGQDPLL
jgi:hypothetical protein